MSTKENPKYVNLRQLSLITSIPLSSLRRFASERRFIIYKINNRILVSLQEFEDYLQQSKVTPREGGEK